MRQHTSMSRMRHRAASALAAVMTAGVLVALYPAPALAAGGPSAPLPDTPSVPVQQDTFGSRPVDQATSQALRGDQAPGGGPADGSGTHTATPLSPSATWSVAEQTGDFTWSYPLRVPPVPGDLTPSLALSYSSSAVDGRTSATNNQPSWVGEGWEFGAGYVERTYGPCLADKEGGTTPPDNGNLCWRSNNATASFDGGGGMLICCDAEGLWRFKSDDGSRVERLTGAGNGDNDGEYWKITKPDGVQYFFGSRAESNSAWTVPVFGDDENEPCHGTTYAASRCVQAWRWNLDRVVDPDGNVMLFQYQKESNSYAEYPSNTAVGYTRGGYLERIDYGLHTTVAAPPAAQVAFAVADRCVPGSTCALNRPENWPDTPLDARCDAATCADHYSPTFWTTKRLGSVTTRVRRGTAMSDVDRWTLEQNYPRPGDGEPGAALWLRSITHTGLAGGEKALPAVTFEGAVLANRVHQGDNLSPLLRYRITGVVSESGGLIAVNYAAPDCIPGQSMPANPESNTLRCFPVTWNRPGGAERTDWFHKHAVARVTVSDRISSGIEQQYGYDYLGGAAWHHDTSEFTEENKRTWNEFRGYQRVRVTVGRDDDPAGPPSATEKRYLRGMNGDKLPGGATRTVSVADSEGVAHLDEDRYQGFPLEEITYDTGSAVVAKTITTPVSRGPTASRDSFHAYQVKPGTVRTLTTLDQNRGRRETKRVNTYDDRGLVTSVSDEGDTATAADDLCTRTTYARNTSRWLISAPSRVETVSVHCGAPPVYPANAVSDRYISYDGKARGAAPDKGNPTRVEVLDRYSGTTPVYVTSSTAVFDDHGRITKASDALNREVSTAYTPAAGGPTTRTVVTNPLGHTTRTDLEVAFGLPVKVTDVNGRSISTTYDPLGRRTAVWLPGRATSAAASYRFAYQINQNEPSVVTTSKLGPNEVYVSSNEIYDGNLRLRQVQAPAVDGGRLITDTRYDSQGRPYKSTSPYFNSQAVDTKLWRASDVDVPEIVEERYDGAGRTTRSIVKGSAVEKWKTTIAYGGDRTYVTPPAGAPPTTTIADARGRTTEVRQHNGTSTAASFFPTRYAYTPDGKRQGMSDAAGGQWSYRFDLQGRLVSAAHPDKGETVYTYDAAGQLKTARDARGQVLSYAYDGLGRQLSVRADSETGRVLTKWDYDTVSDGFGGTVKGMPARSTTYDAQNNAYVSEVLSYTAAYQPRRTALTVPAAAGLPAGTYESWISYKADGSVAGQTFPAVEGVIGQEEVFHTYDDAGRPLTTYGEADGSTFVYVENTKYTRYGEQYRLYLGSGTKHTWISRYYDPATRRLNRVIVDAEVPKPMQSDVHYDYDPAGNVTSIADLTAEQPVDRQCFRYDALRRMTEAWTPGGACDADPGTGGLSGPAPYWQSFTYDSVGNRTSKTVRSAAGDAAETTKHTYGGPGAAGAAGKAGPHTLVATSGADAQTLGYDPAGNLITRGGQRLAWDERGNLASVTEDGVTTAFVYDAESRRLVRTEAGVTTLYLGAQEIQVDSRSGQVAVNRYYDHGGVPVAVRGQDGGVTWLGSDHHGTAQVAIDAQSLTVSKRRLDPFGNPRGAQPGAWPDEKGFVGGTEDTGTGLTHLGAREYDPDLGRFISVDPVLDPADPQQMNSYAYAANNPTTMSDRDGLRYIVDLDGRVTAPGAAQAAAIKRTTGRDVYREADRKVRLLYGNRQRSCPADRDCRTPQQRAADEAKKRAADAKRKQDALMRQLRDLADSLTSQDTSFGENAQKQLLSILEQLGKLGTSASLCMVGEAGALVGASVSVCFNGDAKGFTISGGISHGIMAGFGASAAVRVRLNNLPADKLDVGNKTTLTLAVEGEFGGVHVGGGVERGNPERPDGQRSVYAEVGVGSPIGVNFGGYMWSDESFNSDYLIEWG